MTHGPGSARSLRRDSETNGDRGHLERSGSRWWLSPRARLRAVALDRRLCGLPQHPLDDMSDAGAGGETLKVAVLAVQMDS